MPFRELHSMADLKRFVWRASNNALPTMDNLLRRKVHDDYRAEIFTFIVWLLWNRRNLLHLSKPVHPLQTLPSLAGGMLQDFTNVHEPTPVGTSSTNRWCPPDPHCYKANFNNAIFKSSNTAGLGVVIRDSRGDILGAISVRVPLPQSVPEMEAFAYRHAISFTVDLGLHKVIFEGDSTIVNQAINSGLSSLALYGHIVDDILHLASQLWFYKFCQVPRNCNKVVDAFVRKAQVGLDFKDWVDDVPGNIIPLALFDVR
ncbi:hypothetical protein SO802_000348 [Lithocarpus litseifolius]|uniref:RNase H type-1 domain-containing protein n=1 Tax=Lithocarpus litseifolius TaxID=425828 RepID=A0AAW2DT22_9ROSI